MEQSGLLEEKTAVKLGLFHVIMEPRLQLMVRIDFQRLVDKHAWHTKKVPPYF
jgi:hypothetical protein